jgi:Cell Wall Hydrolase
LSDGEHLELGPHLELSSIRARWALWAVGGACVLLLLVLASTGWIRSEKPKPNPGLTLNVGAPPAVEPVILQQISPDDARKANGETPFFQGPYPAARPFRITGTPADIERATDCLAANIFYEAGNETLDGQMAVAQVVLNRARHPAFPKTVCGVVFQGSERHTGCQFSFACDGSMRRQPSADRWAGYRALARSMLLGAVYAPVGLATHYHTDWVRPVWSATLDKLRAERTHLFFRWSGYWGTPPAFRATYPGAEPIIPKMAILSPAHRTADTDLDALMKSLMLEQPAVPAPLDAAQADVIPPPVATIEERESGTFLLAVDAKTEPALLADMARSSCGTRDYCKVMGWTDKANLPKTLPLTDAQQAALAFSYLRNRNQNFEKALWNCKTFKRADPKQCMRGTSPLGAPQVITPSVGKWSLGPAEKAGAKHDTPAP